jgi:LacI family transcriptional regulator
MKRTRRTTLVEVAARAGVHVSTASRALNAATRHLLSDDVVTRVARAAQELGYRRDPLAPGARGQASGMIGLLVPRIDDPIYPTIFRAVMERLGENYVTFIGETNSHRARQRTLLERMIARDVDGLLIATFHIRDPHVRLCLSAGTPTVSIVRDPELGRISSVVSDDMAAGRLATEHLAALGHREIAHIAGPLVASSAKRRRDGFYAAVAAWPSPITALEVDATLYTIEEGRRCTAEIVERFPTCTGIVAANDMLAFGCIVELRERGIACPGQISVVGINDMPFMNLLSPALTTVRNFIQAVGHEAADLLLKLIENPDQPQMSITLPPQLIVRESSSAPAATAVRR